MNRSPNDLFGSAKVVPVVVPIPADRPYSYAVPDGVSVRPGDIVQVPLGPRKVAGVVWDAPEADDGDVDPKKIRALEQKFDCPALPEEMRRFIDWVAHYTLSPIGMVLRMVLRAPGAFDPEPPLAGIRYKGGDIERLTDARKRVLEYAQDGLAWTRTGLAHAAGVSTSVVDGLMKQGVFEDIMIPPGPVVASPQTDFGGNSLLKKK